MRFKTKSFILYLYRKESIYGAEQDSGKKQSQ
jgi:hypothetical protein